MSCYFQVGDRDLWNPSNSVATLFLDQAEAFSRLVGHSSGLGPIVEDECQVDVARFQKFTGLLVKRYQDSNNRTLRSLTEGFIVVSLVLVQRAGGEVEEIEQGYAEMWTALREAQDRAMPDD
ncbi:MULTISPECIES: DUF6086 family protein [Streptomyces violaceusniger group]|uniref:Uncharacterized protein n=2 Tax=Streptomyces javensis TaxID=114698 RepID=A0ABS0RPT8_9ACTN|nr:DUF6086 family protein [Streptomyces javensis]MBI0319488.1 hypothetical protein [Streptomyces javensis]